MNKLIKLVKKFQQSSNDNTFSDIVDILNPIIKHQIENIPSYYQDDIYQEILMKISKALLRFNLDNQLISNEYRNSFMAKYEKLEFNQYNLKSSPYSGKLVKINDIKNNIKHIIFRDENGLENGFETNDSNNEMITRVLKNGNTEKQSVVLPLYDEPFELSYIKEYKTDKDNMFVPNKRITEMSLKKEGNSQFNIKYNYRYEDQNSSIVRNSTTNNTDYKVSYAKDNGTLSSITRKSQISIQENNETKNLETCLTETLHYDNIKKMEILLKYLMKVQN